jgi:hypothetical protein
MNMGASVDYLFQPKGLDEECAPLAKLYLCAERLEVSDSDYETIQVPFEILGSQVTDKPSGFTGMAIYFLRHPNGCFHVGIQPKGMIPKKRKPIKEREFDLRSCVGKMIPVLTPEQKKESQQREPSPSEVPPRPEYGG